MIWRLERARQVVMWLGFSRLGAESRQHFEFGDTNHVLGRTTSQYRVSASSTFRQGQVNAPSGGTSTCSVNFAQSRKRVWVKTQASGLSPNTHLSFGGGRSPPPKDSTVGQARFDSRVFQYVRPVAQCIVPNATPEAPACLGSSSIIIVCEGQLGTEFLLYSVGRKVSK
jgi:hypothetical protein